MKETILELSPTCKLVRTVYGEGIKPDISLDYTEHSPDGWYSDTETSIDLDEVSAQAIIGFLEGAFRQD